jgi:hypothetical protein
MGSIDTVNQADIRRKSRPDVTGRSDRYLSRGGTAGTGTGQYRDATGIAPVKEHLSQKRRAHLQKYGFLLSKI